MAQGDATDLIMKFVLGGRPIAGESTTNLVSAEGRSNELLAGFWPNCMFEVDSFTFKSGLVDSAATPKQPKPGTSGAAQHGKPAAQVSLPSAANTEFQAWRLNSAQSYPVDLQPVSFTRSIDLSSAQLIQNCHDRVIFDSATLIKRKAAGGQAAGEIFLRLDFYNVLVTNVEWSNDLEVKETCQFICRSVTISYRPQLPDGTLGATIACFWSMTPNATRPRYA